MKCEGWEDHRCKNTNAVKYHMNTKYVDEELNYAVLCPECQKLSDFYWQEQWDDLNADIMCGIRDVVLDENMRRFR